VSEALSSRESVKKTPSSRNFSATASITSIVALKFRDDNVEGKALARKTSSSRKIVNELVNTYRDDKASFYAAFTSEVHCATLMIFINELLDTYRDDRTLLGFFQQQHQWQQSKGGDRCYPKAVIKCYHA